jgi:hypothetical protein
VNTSTVVLQGIVKPDGTLELQEKVPLPPGRVQVIVQPLPDLPVDDPFWQMIRSIWDARNAAGLAPRSPEEVEAERRALREGMEQEIVSTIRLQEESRRLREQTEPTDREKK